MSVWKRILLPSITSTGERRLTILVERRKSRVQEAHERKDEMKKKQAEFVRICCPIPFLPHNQCVHTYARTHTYTD